MAAVKSSRVGSVTYKLVNFAEANEVNQIIDSIPESCETITQIEAALERLIVILDTYQEQPHLLDPHLELFVKRLLGVALDSSSSSKICLQAFKYLYLLTKVRGSKYLVRLFPHEVQDVEIVLALLGKQNPEDHESWETRYILLLWLSIVCMVPFDMSRFDGSLSQTSHEKPIVERILDSAQMYLNAFDKSRDAAALVIAKFVTRPDVKLQNLPKFLSWSLKVMVDTDVSALNGTITMTGILATLALVFKQGKRADLITHAHNVFETADSCGILAINNSLLRKLYIKLIQRLGLTFLKPRLASWRYQRGTRSLSYNLANPYETNAQTDNQESTSVKELEENLDIPEDIEDIIEKLLSGLKDKDTIVRWSAAKGVGRITGRLPKELADDIVGATLDLFTFQETDSAWHGGCLALAELGRRGLLLPQRLSEVVPVVMKALQYDERRGACSVGSNVRDAACYVCWSFARAYEPKDIKPYVTEIACGLLITTLFDRNVKCRRAASAAFQENVGRQGTFPHGIDIVTRADYFEVGKRKNTYLAISVFVAHYTEYCHSLIDHLYKVKLSHWDIEIRELVSKALYNLTVRDPIYMATQVLPAILPLTIGLDLSTRHGSILCAAEITHALYCYANDTNRNFVDLLGSSCVDALEQIVPKLTDLKLFRGLGGELMRPAVCHLIEKMSVSRLQCGQSTKEIWQQTIDDNLNHLQRPIQEKAVSALRAFVTCYYQTSDGRATPGIQEMLINKYTGQLKNSLETAREGFALALGALPKFMLEGKLMKVIESLFEVTMVPETDSGRLAQSRADGFYAIATIIVSVGLLKDGDENSVINESTMTKLYKSCFEAMNDYTSDNRGDVGAWAREASMSCLLKLTLLVVDTEPVLLRPEVCHEMMSCLLKQASEKIDRTRSHAGEIILKLIHLQNPTVPHIPSHEKLLEIFPRTDCESLNWSSPADCFPRISRLLELPCYQYAVLSGVILSAGGLTESLIRQSSLSLRNFLNNISARDEALMGFAANLVKVFKDYQKNDRVILPLFNVLDLLLSNGNLSFLATEARESITDEIFGLTKLEITRIPDARKIITSINVFCGLLQFSGNTRRKSLEYLLILLCHKYPRVRKSTADSLYTALITYEEIVSDESLDEVLNILSETLWQEDIQKIRPQRNMLCDLFGVPKPVSKNVSKPKPATSTTVDSFSSYKDLVSRLDY